MPREISFDPKSRTIGQVIEELRQVPAQTPVDVMRGMQVLRTRSGRIPVVRMHYSMLDERDPDLSPKWRECERRKYTSQASWDREQEIMDEAGGGELVFADTLVTHWKKIVIEDPKWWPDPEWDVIEAGFDHGKANPTCLLRAYHTFDGTIIYAGEYYQPGKEIWQHAPKIKRMRDYERIRIIHADPSMFQYTLQQSQSAGHAAERAKSYAELYGEAGIEKLYSYGGDRSDVSFAARLHLHWANLDQEGVMPTVRIVCRNYSEVPQPGLHHGDCPNLLWELMRTRRVKLSAQQLLSRNTSEAIIDKDNHARDAMKYHLMSHPEPSQKSFERRVNERLGEINKEDPNMATFQYQRIVREEQEQEPDQPTYYTMSARRRVVLLERRLRERGWR